MHPGREMVRTYRWSYVLSKRPDNQNNLTCQSDYTNDTPRYPLHGPVTWKPVRTRPYSMLRQCLRLRICLQSITIIASTAPHCYIRYPMLVPSLASSLAVPCWQPFLTGFDSIVFRFD